MSQEIDYNKVLADLEARKAAIDATIAGIRQMLGLEVAEAADAASGSAGGHTRQDEFHGEVEPGAFHGLSMAEAAKKYLMMVKTKKKTGEICTALLKGGIETSAKNFYSNMFSILKRDKDFIKLGKYWGLAEWHPTRVATAAPRPPKKKRMRVKIKKAVAKKPEGDTSKAAVSTGAVA